MRNDDGEGEQVKKGMDRNTGGGGFHSNFNCLLHVHWFSRRVRKGCPGNLLSNAIYKNRSTAAAAAALIANAALELLPRSTERSGSFFPQLRPVLPMAARSHHLLNIKI